ncbi:accessory gene regulator ArgB-like protein [Paenibacillus sp. GYB003]|uniref:accessory gene regulator ArgB-like protein n=1 Tax=Paenibacillus sp. GYB003 TaxID=2994392 RepID=UPI002F965AE9
MIEAWAEKMAVAIKRTNADETVSVPVMKYALIIVINYFIPVIASLTIGLITGKVGATACSILAFSLIRAFSGGYHFKSAVVCMAVTTAITAIPPHIALPAKWIVVLTAISFLLVAWLAPAGIRGYARMPEKYFPIMKAISLLIVGSNFMINSGLLAILFIIQGVSLFKWKEV